MEKRNKLLQKKATLLLWPTNKTEEELPLQTIHPIYPRGLEYLGLKNAGKVRKRVISLSYWGEKNPQTSRLKKRNLKAKASAVGEIFLKLDRVFLFSASEHVGEKKPVSSSNQCRAKLMHGALSFRDYALLSKRSRTAMRTGRVFLGITSLISQSTSARACKLRLEPWKDDVRGWS